MIGHLLHTIVHSFAHLSPKWVAIGLGFQLVNMLLHGYAYHNVLVDAYPETPPRFLQSLSAFLAGSAGNTFLPARGGEAVKIGLLRMQMPSSNVLTLTGATSIVAIFEFLIGLTFVLVAAPLGLMPSMPVVSKLGHLLDHPLDIVGAAILAALVVYLASKPLRRIGSKLAKGAASLKNPVRWARRVAWYQFAAWSCRVAVAVCFMAAVGLHMSLLAGAIVVVLGGVSAVGPAGGAGAQQVLIVYGLKGLASPAAAIGFSISMQVVVSLFNVVLGVAGLVYVCGRVHPLKAIRMAMQAHQHDHCPVAAALLPHADRVLPVSFQDAA